MLILPCRDALAKYLKIKTKDLPTQEGLLLRKLDVLLLLTPQPVHTLTLVVSSALYGSLQLALGPEEAPNQQANHNCDSGQEPPWQVPEGCYFGDFVGLVAVLTIEDV